MRTSSKRLVRVLMLTAAVGCLAAGTAFAQASAPTQPQTATGASAHGTATKASYDRAMNRIGKEFAKGVGGIYPIASGAKGSAAREQMVRRLNASKGTLAIVATRLGRINVPARVKKLHRRLIDEIGQLRGELTRMVKALQSNNLVSFMRLGDLEALTDIDNTIEQIHSDGYAFLGNSTVLPPCSDC